MTSTTASPTTSRLRRWALVGVVLVILLAAYLAVVTWFAHALQADMQKSFERDPALGAPTLNTPLPDAQLAVSSTGS